MGQTPTRNVARPAARQSVVLRDDKGRFVWGRVVKYFLQRDSRKLCNDDGMSVHIDKLWTCICGGVLNGSFLNQSQVQQVLHALVNHEFAMYNICHDMKLVASNSNPTVLKRYIACLSAIITPDIAGQVSYNGLKEPRVCALTRNFGWAVMDALECCIARASDTDIVQSLNRLYEQVCEFHGERDSLQLLLCALTFGANALGSEPSAVVEKKRNRTDKQRQEDMEMEPLLRTDGAVSTANGSMEIKKRPSSIDEMRQHALFSSTMVEYLASFAALQNPSWILDYHKQGRKQENVNIDVEDNETDEKQS